MENISDGLKHRFHDPKMRQQYVELFNRVMQDLEVAKFLQDNSDVLSRSDIVKGFSKLYEFMTLKEEIKAGKKTYVPGYEPHLITSDHQIEVVYRPTKEYTQNQQENKLKKAIQQIGLPKSLINARIENYDLDGREEPLRAALQFIDGCSAYLLKHQNHFPKGLYLSGSLGVGKSYLLAATAIKLVEKGIETKYYHFPTFSGEMMNSIGENRTSQLINQVKNYPVVIFDDIGSTQITPWMRDNVLGIILEYRMSNELPTLFSSNLSIDELRDQYLTVSNKGDSEPLKAMRITERIRFLANEYQMVGPNRRNFQN